MTKKCTLDLYNKGVLSTCIQNFQYGVFTSVCKNNS